MLDQIEAFFSLSDRFKRFLAKRKEQAPAETLVGRFFRLFEAHGVHRNQIPRFFGHGLQLKDVQDEAALLQCLTDAHLADACTLFGVQRQWLERGEGSAHQRLGQFYGNPLAFGTYLDEMLAARTCLQEYPITAQLWGVLSPNREVDATLRLAEPIGLLNDEVIYRYHHVDCGPLGYWKARVSTAALVAQALRRALWITGRDCDDKKLRHQTYETDLWANEEIDTLMGASRRMDVEDWLLLPEALLKGVDPERGRFGVFSALEMWLRLDAEGLMSYLHAREDRRAVFEAALHAENTV